MPGKSLGWRSLIGYSPWCSKELDTTEQLHCHFQSSLRHWIKTPVSLGRRDTGSDPTAAKKQFWACQLVLVVKNLPANAGDVGSVPRLERCSGGGHGTPLQFSCLENPMDRGAWRATVHKFSKSQTRLKCLSMHTCRQDTSGHSRCGLVTCEPKPC